MNFKQYTNITDIVIPNGVRVSDCANAFSNMQSLTNASITSGSLTSMYHMFYDCRNLVSEPTCGQNVTNMSHAYMGCDKLKGKAVCGPNVTDMTYAYGYCNNLTEPVCGPNVVHMGNAYNACPNLKTAVCGPNVVNMANSYTHCDKITTSVCGPNVTNMYRTYWGCNNIQGNAYFYSNLVSNVFECFRDRRSQNILNIYVHNGSTTFNSLMRNTKNDSVYGVNMTWTNDFSTNKRYYSSTYNLYIYPVANVEAARIANGDPDYMGNL